MFHYPPIKLPIGEKTISFCCEAAPTDLIVFIHGFNGDALNTWKDFPKLMTTHSKFETCDIVFWGYDSLKGQAGNSKIKFFKSLDYLANPLNVPDYPKRNLSVSFRYKRIIIVAHSLGAVITRLALLHAQALGRTWLGSCRLLFFAPAHWGSRLPENFKECFFGFSVLLEAFAVTKYPIIKDLTENSSVLNYIKDETSKLLLHGNCDFLKAKVIWAERENIVINIPYGQDEPEDEIISTTHMSVCKPVLPDFVEPFDRLLQLI